MTTVQLAALPICLDGLLVRSDSAFNFLLFFWVKVLLLTKTMMALLYRKGCASESKNRNRQEHRISGK